MKTTQAEPANTPGYHTRLTVAFTSNKRGTRIAYRWCGRTVGDGRWVRFSLENAKMFAEQGLVTVVPYIKKSDWFK